MTVVLKILQKSAFKDKLLDFSLHLSSIKFGFAFPGLVVHNSVVVTLLISFEI